MELCFKEKEGLKREKEGRKKAKNERGGMKRRRKGRELKLERNNNNLFLSIFLDFSLCFSFVLILFAIL